MKSLNVNLIFVPFDYSSDINFNGKDFTLTPPDILLNHLDYYLSFAYDWVHKTLYWFDNDRRTIDVLLLHGKQRKTLISSDVVQVTSMAVDPRDGQKWIYWTDWGNYGAPRIERAGLDGSKRTLLVDDNLVWPIDIVIDFAENRLYWTDQDLHTSSSCDLDGQNVREVVNPNMGEEVTYFASLAVFDNNLYWSDWMAFKVFQADKRNATSYRALTSRLSYNLAGLTVYHERHQPKGKFFLCISVTYSGCHNYSNTWSFSM